MTDLPTETFTATPASEWYGYALSVPKQYDRRSWVQGYLAARPDAVDALRYFETYKDLRNPDGTPFTGKRTAVIVMTAPSQAEDGTLIWHDQDPQTFETVDDLDAWLKEEETREPFAWAWRLCVNASAGEYGPWGLDKHKPNGPAGGSQWVPLYLDESKMEA